MCYNLAYHFLERGEQFILFFAIHALAADIKSKQKNNTILTHIIMLQIISNNLLLLKVSHSCGRKVFFHSKLECVISSRSTVCIVKKGALNQLNHANKH